MPASYACFFQAMFSHCGRRRTFSDDIWIHSNDPPSCRSSSVMRMATAMDPPWSRSTVGGVGRRGSARVPSSGLLVKRRVFFVVVSKRSLSLPSMCQGTSRTAGREEILSRPHHRRCSRWICKNPCRPAGEPQRHSWCGMGEEQYPAINEFFKHYNLLQRDEE
jgi:hypothetical protein